MRRDGELLSLSHFFQLFYRLQLKAKCTGRQKEPRIVVIVINMVSVISMVIVIGTLIVTSTVNIISIVIVISSVIFIKYLHHGALCKPRDALSPQLSAIRQRTPLLQ